MDKRKMMVLDRLLGGGGTPSYTISGTVYDADGATPVEGATVALGLLTATSAANGTYTISNVPAGTSGSMTCTLAGYSWAAITVAVMSGNLTGQDYDNAWWAAGGSAANAYAAYKPIGAASLAASKVNLVSAGSHDLVNGATPPTWDATNGWIFGANAYLTSDIQPAGTWTLICRFAGVPASGSENFIFGVFDGGGNEIALAPWNGGAFIRYENPNTVSFAPNLTSGVSAIAGANGFRNGTKEVTTLTISPGTSSKVLYVGALNLNGSVYGALAKNIQAFAVYNATLSDARVAAISTAMAALSP
jgi:hypothetical protein